MLAEELRGIWELVSLETRRSDGPTTRAFGDHPIGQFIFDASGRFSVQLMNPDRSDDLDRYSAFWGEYEVNETDQCFVLLPMGSLRATMIGLPTERFVSFVDDFAVFTPGPQLANGITVQTFITWKKVVGLGGR